MQELGVASLAEAIDSDTLLDRNSNRPFMVLDLGMRLRVLSALQFPSVNNPPAA